MELVGRQEEQSVLEAVLERVDDGFHCVLVRGGAGTGKSALLAHATAAAGARGQTVMTAELTAAEHHLRWCCVASLLRSAPTTMAGDGSLDRASWLEDVWSPDTRSSIDDIRIAENLRSLVDRLSADAPVCIVVDDAHWLDTASAGALSLLIRSVADRRVTVLLAVRPGRLAIDVDRLLPPAAVTEVEVSGLPHDSLHLLLSTRFDINLSGTDLDRLHEFSRGNPRHVLETARLMQAGTGFEDALSPQSLLADVAAEVVALPAAVLDVLGTAALMAAPDVATLVHVHGKNVVEDALVDAQRAGLVLITETGALTFPYPLLRAGVIDSMGAAERRRAHRRLSDLVDDIEERSVHIAEAAWGTDAVAASAMGDAADHATERGDRSLAAVRARRALELTPPDHLDDIRRRRLVAADASFRAGHVFEACRLYEAAVADAVDLVDQLDALYGLVVATARAHGDVAAATTAQELVERSAGHDNWHIRGLKLLARLFLGFDLARAEAATIEAIVATRRLDDTTEVDLEPMLLIIRVLRGEPVALDGLLDGLSARAAGGEWSLGALAIGEALVWCDRLDEAFDMQQRELARAEAAGHLIGVMNALDQLSDINVRRGAWAEADALLTRFYELSVRIGADARTGSRLAELAWLKALRGERQAADELLRRAGSMIRTGGILERAQFDIRAGMVAQYAGDPGRAVELIRRGNDALVEIGLVDMGALIYWSDLVEALVGCGDVDEAEQLVVGMEAAARRSGRPRAALEAARSRGLVALARGDLTSATTATAGAFAALDGLQSPFERARVDMLAGVIARRSNQRAAARRHLTAALDAFTRLGAAPFVRRASLEADRLGAVNTNVLTSTEQQVATLVAEGLSNTEVAARLFIARRTVEANLSRVYRKLGVRTRTEMAAQLHRR